MRCEPLLTQRSGITETKCVRDTWGQEANAEQLPGRGPQLASQVFWPRFGSVLHCCPLRSARDGDSVVGTKVYTVHVGHCPPVSCMHVIIAIDRFGKSEQY